MFSKLVSKFAVFLIRSKKLSGEHKMRIMNALLVNVYALPIQDIVKLDQNGTLLVRGRQLTIEQAQSLIQSAAGLKDNFARKLIQEQVKFEAVKIGIHKALDNDALMFSKAALWYIEQEEAILSEIVSE